MVRGIKKKVKAKSKTKKSSQGGSSSKPLLPAEPAKVWQPGVDALEEGEELQFDPSAYDYLRGFNIGWPCLSFDVVLDSLGLVRTDFPHTLYGVAGTQAEQATHNYIGVFKLSNINGKKRDLVPSKSIDDDDDADSDSSSDEDDEDMDDDSKPFLQLRKIAHHGCVNRIRSMPQKSGVVVTWAETGYVQVWDLSKFRNSLAESERTRPGNDNIIPHGPLKAFKGHKTEGYAIDWNPLVAGRLVSGDCNWCIHVWEPTSDTWAVDPTPYVGHKGSVEDLQWSPTEPDVFASCSVDGTLAIWDLRKGRSPVVSIKAHNVDVNVISWNRLSSCMIASGCDDGSFSIRDLRLIQGDSVVAHFEYHKRAITSIEWCPHESSTLAVSSADNQLTFWDLSLERDPEEEAEFKEKVSEQVNAPENLPPQLLFIHQGQKDLKELHWHPQIPGMVISTAGDGFNVLMPSNITSTLPTSMETG